MQEQPIQTTMAPPKKKSSGSGCLIAALIVGGLVLLVLLIGGIALFQATRTGKGKAILGMITEGVKMAEEGMNAPGAAEVRELGCDQAFVMDMSRFIEFVEPLATDGDKPFDKKKFEKEFSGPIVACRMTLLGDPPTCDEVAATYVKALGGSAPQPFKVIVQAQGRGGSQCFASYSANGTRTSSEMDMMEGGGVE